MSRALKRNKTKLEKLMMQTWYDTNNDDSPKTEEQRHVVRAIKEMLRHFEMEDYLYGSNHVKIIKKVYLSAKYEKILKGKAGRKLILITKGYHAEKFHMDTRTLRDYTNLYIKCFEKNLIEIIE